MTGTRAIRLSLLLAGFASQAQAQLHTEGPFLGQVREGFETHLAGDFSECLGSPILGGLGTVCTPGTTGATVSTGETFVCTVTPFAGSQFLTSVDGALELRFDGPVQRFGARFATSSAISDATLTFYDWNDALIDVPQIAVVPGDCGWVWQGWRVDGPGIARIVIAGNSFNDGAFVQVDQIEVDAGTSIGTFCAGDGSSGPCPCGNVGVQGHGCSNSAFAAGARLSVEGSSSLRANDLIFHVEAVPPGELVVLASGIRAPTSQAPPLFGDGLLCLRGQLQRVAIGVAGSDGQCSMPGVAVSQSGLEAGAIRHYQAWYRDSVNAPCNGAANFSAGLSLLWTP